MQEKDIYKRILVNFLKISRFFLARLPFLCYTIRCKNGRTMPLENDKEECPMANRVVISICGEEYTFVAEESSAYMQKVGSYVGDKMAEVLGSAKVGRTDAAVLTAANIADELFKSQAVAEQLRAQIKGYLDEANKAQSEVSELKREIFRLQQRLEQRHK